MEQHSARTTEHDPRDAGGAPRPDLPRPSRAPREAKEARESRNRNPRTPRSTRDRDAARDQPAGRDRNAVRDRNAPRRQQHQAGRTRTPQRSAPHRGTRGTAAAGSPLTRIPAPRLTALGAGVFATLLMVATGGIEGLLTDGAPAFYGTVFVLVCLASALWVRPRELFAAPVAAPLAYTIGLFFAGGPGDGFAGVLQNVFTGLALHAGWLYGGTLAAVVVVLARKAALSVLRNRAERAQHRPR